jgi:hypothetical protein
MQSMKEYVTKIYSLVSNYDIISRNKYNAYFLLNDFVIFFNTRYKCVFDKIMIIE